MSIQKHRRRSKEHDPNQGSKLLKQVPDEIMELILQRLDIFEYLAFRQVCRPWRALSKLCPPAPHLPWLLFNSHPYYIQDRRFVSCLSSNPPKLFHESRCLGSAEGWLIMAALKYSTSPAVNYLLNPMTGSRVELPPQSTIQSPQNTRVDFMQKAVASFEQTKLENWLIACLCADGRLAFCRPIDESWILIEARKEMKIRDVEIIGEKLYAVTFSRTLMVFNIQGVTYTAERSFELYKEWLPIHLTKDVASKDLFIVYRTRSFEITGFIVFKLECKKGDDRHLVPVYDLGDRNLFVSDLDTKIISSSSSSSGDTILESSFIYYSLHLSYSKSGREFGVYYLPCKCLIKLLTLPDYVSPIAVGKDSSVWFTPNPW